MAELQCLESVKKRLRPPSQKCIEAAFQDNTVFETKTRRKQNTVYEIEVIKEDGPRVKVHYIGYSAKYDEWKLRYEVLLKQPRTMPWDMRERAMKIASEIRPMSIV